MSSEFAFQSKNLLLSVELGEPNRVAPALAMEVAFVSTGGVSSPHRSSSSRMGERGDLFAMTRIQSWGGYVTDLVRDDRRPRSGAQRHGALGKTVSGRFGSSPSIGLGSNALFNCGFRRRAWWRFTSAVEFSWQRLDVSKIAHFLPKFAAKLAESGEPAQAGPTHLR